MIFNIGVCILLILLWIDNRITHKELKKHKKDIKDLEDMYYD